MYGLPKRPASTATPRGQRHVSCWPTLTSSVPRPATVRTRQPPCGAASWAQALAPSQASVVQALSSLSHAAPAGAAGCVQVPAPSHSSSVQALPSAGQAVSAGSGEATQPPVPSHCPTSQPPEVPHGLVAASNVQPPEQQSPLVMLPSSQASRPATLPLPQPVGVH